MVQIWAHTISSRSEQGVSYSISCHYIFQTQPYPILTLYRASAVPPRAPLPLYVQIRRYLIRAGKSCHHSAGPALPLSWSPDQSSSLGHNHHLSPEARRNSGSSADGHKYLAPIPITSWGTCKARMHASKPPTRSRGFSSAGVARSQPPPQGARYRPSPGSHGHGLSNPICWPQLGKGIESLICPACSASDC